MYYQNNKRADCTKSTSSAEIVTPHCKDLFPLDMQSKSLESQLPSTPLIAYTWLLVRLHSLVCRISRSYLQQSTWFSTLDPCATIFLTVVAIRPIHRTWFTKVWESNVRCIVAFANLVWYALNLLELQSCVSDFNCMLMLVQKAMKFAWSPIAGSFYIDLRLFSRFKTTNNGDNKIKLRNSTVFYARNVPTGFQGGFWQ